jgi:hypothetical protein
VCPQTSLASNFTCDVVLAKEKLDLLKNELITIVSLLFYHFSIINIFLL